MQNSITRSRDGDRIRLRSRHFSRLFWSIRQNLRRNRYKQVSRQSLTLSLAKRNHSNKTNLERRVRARTHPNLSQRPFRTQQLCGIKH
jgi:hypothetical protein